MKRASAMTIPAQSSPVQRGLARSRQAAAFSQSGCEWWRCATVVAGCIGACSSGIGSAACVACLGSAYNSCKDCF